MKNDMKQIIQTPAAGRCITRAILILSGIFFPLAAEAQNVAEGAKVEASSFHEEYRPEFAVDGIYHSVNRRWLNDPSDLEPWIVINFGEKKDIKAVSLVFDPRTLPTQRDVTWVVENYAGGRSGEILGEMRNTNSTRNMIEFGSIPTDQIRIIFTKGPKLGEFIRIHEIEVWAEEQDLEILPEVIIGGESVEQ